MIEKKIAKKRKKIVPTKSISEITRLKLIIQEKEKEIETLTEISKSIVSGRYLEEILHIVVSLTAEMMGSKICSIMLLDKNQQELKSIATQSLSTEYRNKPNINVGQSISGRAVVDKKPVTVLNVTKENGYAFKEIALKEGLKSMLAVPMILRNNVMGVINIYTTDRKSVV